ncbi:IS110 family transposase [Halomonas halodenitrificans]|uniref:IS110 family transposase n=1 Tax=Halomonas halodenitrificans TaxID=28252 RepID=UPI0006841A04|nr:IS110 family transposase [Halomonas halodenitrificans]
MAQVEELIEVVLGVDTHLDVHVGVVIDPVGRVLGTRSIKTCTDGYQKLLEWACSFGSLVRAGVEGTGTYGAGLARYLQEAGIEVLEVNRPDRSRRRRKDKNDPTDAENAARAVLSGEACALPKAQSGAVEAMRTINVARRSAVKARTQALNQLRSLLVSAPQALHEQLLKPKAAACVAACLELETEDDSILLQTLKSTLQLLARR